MTSTVDQLDRITKLAAALTPLANKQRGMPIQAEDWNALVSTIAAILEIDRAQEVSFDSALAGAYASRSHEHLGGVSLPWLAPDLQSRVGGPGGAVGILTALSDMSRRLEAALTEVARISAALDQLAQRIDRSAVDDVDRNTRLRTFEDRFTGIEDLRTTVTTVQGGFEQLTANVTNVLKVGAALTDPQGNPIDIAALQGNVAALQGLTANFTGVTGQPLKLSDLELKIQDLTDQLKQTTGGDVDKKLSVLVTGLEGRLDTKLDARATGLAADLQTGLEAGRQTAHTELQQALDTSRTAIDATITARLQEAAVQTNAALDARATELSANLKAELATSTQQQITDGLANVPTIVDQRLSVTETRLGGIIDQKLNARLGNVVLPPVLPLHRAPRRGAAAAADRAAGATTLSPAPKAARPTAKSPSAAMAPAKSASTPKAAAKSPSAAKAPANSPSAPKSSAKPAAGRKPSSRPTPAAEDRARGRRRRST